MDKRYEISTVMYDRYAVWYMKLPKSKNKLGVWKIIDLFPGTRPTRFAFRWKVKGKEKTQEQLDIQMLGGAIRNFHKDTNMFRGNRSVENQTQSRAA